MNKGGQRSVDFSVPAEWDIGGATLTDALGGSRTVTMSGNNGSIELNEWEYVVLVP